MVPNYSLLTIMKHIVLLGDSIFANESNFSGEKDTITNLREQLPDDWTATLLAEDNSVADDLASQLPNVPADATHLFVSVSRNDAYEERGIWEIPASSALDTGILATPVSSADVLNKLSNVVKAFEWRYSQMLDDILVLNKPTVVCTFYFPRSNRAKFFHAKWMKLYNVVYSAFNEVIMRHALMRGLPVIDLRYVCDEYDQSLANAQIAERIIHVVNECDFSQKRTVIFTNEVPAAKRIKGFTGIPLLLTEAAQKKHNITKDEIEAGMGGSPQIAALLTVKPENWSENQKWKADKLRELDFRESEIFGFMEIERIQNRIGAAL